ncbi:MAG TPA: ferredoxin III, nif-specific [Leptolyngbyaceae cyanobacterium]
MAVLTGLTYGGNTWTPKFAQAIDKDKCIGCGRCIKVCGYPVLDLKALNEEGEFVEDEDDDEIERKVMVVAHPENCIGCEACARICPKNCYSHAALEN